MSDKQPPFGPVPPAVPAPAVGPVPPAVPTPAVGPVPPAVPAQAVGPEGLRTVRFEGSVQLFVSQMPEASFVDLTDSGNHPVFASCWIDGKRGKTAHVQFPAGSGVGVFNVDMEMKDGDPDMLKVQISMRMLDSKSGNRRTVPLSTSCACLRTMLTGEYDRFRMPDQFNPSNYVNASMRILNHADFQGRSLQLKPSALRKIGDFNKNVKSVSQAIENNNKLNQTQFPAGAESMRSGDSSREFSGRLNIVSGEKEIEDLSTHYAIMNAQEECVDRALPLAVVLYHVYLKAVHSGMSFQQILELNDVEFGKFGAEAMQITCSAGLFPYEQDFVPGISLSFFHGLQLQATPTEDMGWPLSQGQLDGRTIRDIGKIPVNRRMTLAELMGLFEQPPVPSGSIRPLVSGSTFTPCGQQCEGTLPDVYLSICADDCESSSLAARQAKMGLLKFVMSQASPDVKDQTRIQALKKECADWGVFRSFTDASWGLMSRFVNRLGGMLMGKQLRVMTGVGLASNASAGQEESGGAHTCGHCFNVGYVQTPQMSSAVPFLLEGTAAMYSVHVDEHTPRVTVCMTSEDQSSSEIKVMNMPNFLTALAGTVTMLCTVINSPNGQCGEHVGWPMPVEVRGWISKTDVTPALTSAGDTPLPFYNRIMYMGWPCTMEGVGCMPVQEKQQTKIAAGCHPYELTHLDLRAVDATLPTEAQALMTEIMEEAVQPQASVETVRRIAGYWIPCRPLEQINCEPDLVREKGVKYHRVVCMECPCAPEYLSIIHEAKQRLVGEANRINDARPDSDGIRLYSLMEGVDDLLCIDVKDQEIKKLTIVDSIKEAMVNVGWPVKQTASKKKVESVWETSSACVKVWNVSPSHRRNQQPRHASGRASRAAQNP